MGSSTIIAKLEVNRQRRSFSNFSPFLRKYPKMAGGYFFTHPNGLRMSQPVEVKNWPCGKLDAGGSAPGKHLFNDQFGNGCVLEFEDINNKRIKIKTQKTMHKGYDMMYMADSGSICYDKFSDNVKQIWKARVSGKQACFEATWWPGHYLGHDGDYLSSEDSEVWWT